MKNRKGWILAAATIAGFVLFGCSGGNGTPFLDYLYVVDSGNNRIVRLTGIDENAEWTELSESPDGTQRLNCPRDIAFDESGRMYIASQNPPFLVRVDDLSGAGWTAFGTTRGAGTGEFEQVHGVDIDRQGRILVTDRENHRLVRIDDMDGTNWIDFGSEGSKEGEFDSPMGIVVDESGTIHVVEFYNGRISMMSDLSGSDWASYGSLGSGSPGDFGYPVRLRIDGDGRYWVTDAQFIFCFDDWEWTNWKRFGILGDGVGEFDHPRGIEILPSGQIVVADTNNDRLVVIDDMDGTNWTEYDGFGTGTEAFSAPSSVVYRREVAP